MPPKPKRAYWDASVFLSLFQKGEDETKKYQREQAILLKTATRAQEVLADIEQPLPHRRFPFRRRSRASSSVPPPHSLAAEMRRWWVQDSGVTTDADNQQGSSRK